MTTVHRSHLQVDMADWDWHADAPEAESQRFDPAFCRLHFALSFARIRNDEATLHARLLHSDSTKICEHARMRHVLHWCENKRDNEKNSEWRASSRDGWFCVVWSCIANTWTFAVFIFFYYQ